MSEEGIHLGPAAVVPALSLALGAPVAALQHQPGARFKLMAEGAAEGELGPPVAGGHGLGEELSAPEFGGPGHIGPVELALGLGFVVAVVHGHHRVPIGEVVHFAGFLGKGLPGLATAPVGVDMVLHVILQPVPGPVLAVQELRKGALDDGAHELLAAGQFADDPAEGLGRAQLLQVGVVEILHGVGPEVEVVLQLVGVQVVLAVEVPRGVDLGIDDVVDVLDPDLPVHDFVHGVGVHPAAFAPADVVDVAPEGGVQGALRLVGAEVPHQAAAVPIGGVFEDVVQAVVKLDGVPDLGHGGANDARLPQAHPVSKAAFDDVPLGGHLRYGVVVEHAGLDGVADPAPVDGRHPVPGLGHGADVNEASAVVLAQVLDRFDQVPGGAVVVRHGLLRVIIRLGGHESRDVQDNISPLNAGRHVLPVQQVAPMDVQPFRIHIGGEEFPVLLAVPEEEHQVVKLPQVRQHLLEAFEAHAAPGASHEHSHIIRLSCPKPGSSSPGCPCTAGWSPRWRRQCRRR